MTRTLSRLLGADEPMFSIRLEQLERESLNQNIDVRLHAEVLGRAFQKTRELGLDPKDSTGEELYHSLLSLVGKHDEFMARFIGAKDTESVDEILPKVKDLIGRLPVPKEAWVIKPSIAKRLIKNTPPQKIMKHLGYKSVDSMIKRESIYELFGALRFAEDPKWLNDFVRKYKNLRPGDFETRNIEVALLDKKKWGALAENYVRQSRSNITHLKELGEVIILPMPVNRLRGVTLATISLVLHYINEIRIYSAFFKMQQVKSDFGEILVRTIIHDPADHAMIAGHNIHWRIIHRHFGRDRGYHPEVLEPHIQPEDLHIHTPEEVLYRLEPALHFWHNMDYIGILRDGLPVSFNLRDMAVNHLNNLAFGQHALHNFRGSLGNELLVRYLGQGPLLRQVLKQLDYGFAPNIFYAEVESGH